MFPQARDVHLYLKDYATRYIPSENISLRTRVCKVSQLADIEARSPRSAKKWLVEWETVSDTKTDPPVDRRSRVFDHIAIASGFFSAPHIPSIPGLEHFKKDGKVFHSSNYHEFFRGEKGTMPKKVVVVGGCLSSVEVVSDLVFRQGGANKMEIIHLFPRPFWISPRYLRTPDSSLNAPPSFLPLDLVLYDGYRKRNAQKPGVEPPKQMTPEEKNTQANEFMRSQIGNGDQSSLSPHLKISPQEMRLPPYIAISDSYANFVRSKEVHLERGYLTSIKRDSETGRWNCLEISSTSSNVDHSVGIPQGEKPTKGINGVDMIIFATGFESTNSFPQFLPHEMLQDLSYDPDDNFLPALLYDQILHPSLMSYDASGEDATTHAGFIGMYKGPYFGVLEFQARYLAGLFQERIQPPPKSVLENEIAEFRTIREKRKSGKWESRGQWSWGDYLGIMEGLEGRVFDDEIQKGTMTRGIENAINAVKMSNMLGDCAPVIPAHFAPHPQVESQDAISTLNRTIKQAMKEAKFTAKATFRSLQGSWQLTRTLHSRLKEMPSGTFVGTAKFVPRTSTFNIRFPEDQATTDELSCSLKRTRLADGIGETGDKLAVEEENRDITEYIYSEHGTFTLSTLPYFSFPAVRKYIYRYHPGTDSISVWFVKPQSGTVPSASPPSPEEELEGDVDYLFHEIEFFNGQGAHGERSAKGKEHLCERDLYKAWYKFNFSEFGNLSSSRGAEISQFSIGYNVRGPKKDYTSEGIFTRL